MGMMQLNCGRVPATAQSIGLGGSFRYLRGASGRRYLFSLLRDSDFDDLQNVVMIEATVTDSDPAPVWLGEIDSEGVKSGYVIGYASGTKCSRFVHFLAGNDDDRHATMIDLAGGRA
jgi:hypothetical protein